MITLLPPWNILGERLAELNGQKMRFYLFKIGFEDEEGNDTESYLGMAGPYEIDPKNLVTTNDATGYQYDEAYNKKQVDKHFRTLLDNAEDYIKKWKNKQGIKPVAFIRATGFY
ncbi:MAG: hypothetical protein IPL27_19305 [Lewinellaceae bacterium]|nr:hypothetical protein [Lewinellaceae bacterium]